MPLTTTNDSDEPVENALARLVPAAPSAQLAERLAAASPAGTAAQHKPHAASRAPHRHVRNPSRPRLTRWIAGTAAAAAVVLALATVADRRDADTADTVPQASPGAGESGASVRDSAAPPALAGAQPSTEPHPQGDQLFLPVAANRRIVEVRPAYYVQRPDEAPRRVAEVIWVEEVTAVGADADDTLYLERTGSTLVPVEGEYY